jgi:hypothetical protein
MNVLKIYDLNRLQRDDKLARSLSLYVVESISRNFLNVLIIRFL